MTDIVKELRALALESISYTIEPPVELATEAADEIERLRAALRELVRLKDLHDACDDKTYWSTRAVSEETLTQLRAWEADYAENKSLAWSAARAIVGEIP